METVTISPKYQVMIPKQVRDQLCLLPGQKIQVTAYGACIQLIPVRPMRELRGYLKGLDTSVERAADRA